MSTPSPVSMVGASLQSQVIAAVVDRLDQATSARAYRTRMSAFATAQLPAFNVFPDDGEAEYGTAGVVSRTFRFYVRHMAVALDQVDVAADALYVAGNKALMADPTLGGLVRSLREGKQKWEMEKGEVEIAALVVTYEAEFTTARADPSRKGY